MRAEWTGMLVIATVAGSIAGCSHEPAPATVSGVVKVDGKELEKGIISFAPIDGVGQPATGNIEKGQYSVRTTAGKKQVQISAPVVKDKRKESPAPNAPWVEITAESLPARYHVRSELSFDTQPGGNTKDWDLHSK